MTEVDETIRYLNKVGLQVHRDVWQVPTADNYYMIVSRCEDIFTCGMIWAMGLEILEVIAQDPLVAAKLAEPIE